MFFLQMAGFPGSGKSTLSKEISKRTGAIIVDHDVVKSALLTSIGDNRIDNRAVGAISYTIEWALIDSHLSTGHSVILDSPCFYPEMVEKGVKLSEKHKAKYKYVECYLNDINVVQQRLKNRERVKSQIQQVESEAAFFHWVENSKRPDTHEYLVIDSRKPLDSYINDVITYIHT
ncbi:AAA family ATPase [Peribacillus deserti]|uniref:ATP-binding protein n=1 Tax=Peribacillus deserti TaxID=673318 RepID=A0A2N5MBR9_9BACI|nr:AAA family ATPase [Peribacillus deserti]PLT31755.1 ATP-binding protein [Peribacillus deserti]